MSKEPVTITLAHCRRLNYCRSGIERFCLLVGIEFNEFCRVGISSTRLDRLDDMYVKRLVDSARRDS